MEQLSRIESIAARQGNTYAAAQIQQAVQTQQTAAAVGDAVGAGVMFIFNVVEQAEREARARREREEARREAERDFAESLIPDWKQLDRMASSFEKDPDFEFFQRSAEADACARDGKPWRSARAVLEGLEVAATDVASDAQRKQALTASDEGRASLECQAGAFKSYTVRVAELCAQLFELEPPELKRAKAEHADLPRRCIEAAEEAHHQALSRSLKGVTPGASQGPATLHPVGSGQGASPMGLKPLSP